MFIPVLGVWKRTSEEARGLMKDSYNRLSQKHFYFSKPGLTHFYIFL